MRTILVLVLLATVSDLRAQQATVRGRVTDADGGAPLPGVNVVYGPGQGTATDVDGRYELALEPGTHTFTFSLVGYAKMTEERTLAAGEQVQLDVVLSAAEQLLDMVVVTAGRFEQRVGEVTQSLSVLPPQVVLNKNINALNDAMDQVPGVVVIDNDPQIRAGSGFSYGAGSRVMMLVDDMPILSGDIGRPSWTFLPIENLEQVEVIKGASSVMHGSAALSGVINVRTAYPRSEPRTRATVFAGMYDAPRRKGAKWWGENNPLQGGASFFHSRQFGNFDLVLGGNAFSDAGYVGPEPIAPDTLAKDPYRTAPANYENRIRFNVGTRWRSKRTEGLSYGVNANVMKSRSTNVFIWNDVDSGLYRSFPGTVTRTLGTQYTIDPFVVYLTPGGMRHSLKVRYYFQDFENDNAQSNASHFLYGEYQVQQQFDLLGPTTLTAGLVGQRTRSVAELYTGNSDGSDRNTATNAAGYLQLDKKLLRERLALSAGVRYERFQVNEDEQARPVVRAGATYRVLEGTFLRTSYGQGFRFPTIGERFITTGIGQLNIYPNPDLRPEESWNLEAGVKQGFRIRDFTGYIDAVVFRQEFSDYVEFTFGQWGDPSDLDNLLGLGFRSVNTGGARVTGYELELAGRGNVGGVEWAALLGWTHTLPVSTTPDQVYATPTFPNSIWPASTYANTSYDPSDNILKFRVQDLFRGDLQGERGRWMAGVSVRYNSHVRNIDRAFVDLDESGLLPTGVGQWMATHTTGDWILDTRFGWRVGEHQRITFIVNNLTNTEYAVRPLAIEPMRSYQVQFTYSH